MFQYFPGNYMWSLSVMRCLASGGHFGEIHWALQDLQDAAKLAPQGDTEAWHAAWKKLAVQVEGIGRTALEDDKMQTAASALMRAAHYWQWAEAFIEPGDDRAAQSYERHLACFRHAGALLPNAIEVVEVPFGETALTAYFVKAEGVSGPAPAVILSDGLDGTKEEMVLMAQALASRGISCLAVDNPGQGATLRLKGLKARHDSEVAAGAAYDYLKSRSDLVDPDRVGLIAASMGGYYAPRAVAFEKRIKACVAWGAIYDYHAVWVRRLNLKPGTKATVDYRAALGTTGKHLLNIIGATDFDEALRKFESFTLKGVAQNITCDILLVHGEDDKQTPLSDAQKLYDEIGSTSKELRVFTRAEGGASHVQLDRQEPAVSLIADWMTDHL
ncbi:alpha/beta hydrolase family protein [Paraburkholderia elongata]|uniref:Alpha/beta fold hydrolase n=1 Tax=Paraburkholderia elongata TaxID=2675747 RepID=A0A972SM40_9BURK|nr:alpha/beta fold hydrolase [Paraburkholderia elongata]NPT59772.1 alpha/beta fold hydrolase [Paraburkholderia elongata]